MLITDSVLSLKRIQAWLYITWLKFLIDYRKTFLGPAWLLVGPSLFIGLLGFLYSHINGVSPAIFIPHLAIGLVVWTLISGFVTGSATVFRRNRPQIMQGTTRLTDIVVVDVFSVIIQFLHQTIVVIAVFVFLNISVGLYALVSLFGFALLVLNGLWLTIFFGIIGARSRDLSEVVNPIMRIAFLATPIIWKPDDHGHGGVLGAFLTFNPLFHFLELVRAPLLGQPIATLSWLVVLSITFIGLALAQTLYKRFARQVPFWI